MNNLSLYIHYPFCKKKCAYCDFYSGTDTTLFFDYEKALAKSITAFSEKAKDYAVSTVYFGGGTPSLFTLEGIERVFSSIKENYNLLFDAEISVEMNPESAKEEVIEAFVREGVNRISFGMQSACEEELSHLGRLHSFSDVKDSVERARKIGVENISLDLMYGLPNQTLSSFRESLEKALSLSPRHISFYLLTLSPEVPLYREKDELPDEETVREMYFFASDFLKKNGFEHYEISNAALPGFRSRHNEIYWTGGDYIGFGPGAHSFFEKERFYVKEGTREFILASNPENRIVSVEKVDEKEALIEYLMLSLRRKEGICLDTLSRLSSKEFCEKLTEKMTLWSEHGLCEKTSCGFALTTKGFFVSNEIISELI